MKKTRFLLMTALLVCVIIVFTACNPNNQISEETLIAEGHSLNEALPSFKTLNDNYMYRQKIQQTNGTDSFTYDLVKFDNGNIYNHKEYYSNYNAGWEYEEDALTDYTNFSNIPYTIYTKQSNDSYFRYSKFKYNSTDEEFQKLYYTDNETYEINAGATEMSYDFSFLNVSDFEYITTTDESGKSVVYWNAKSNTLVDNEFKTNVLNAFHRPLQSGETIGNQNIYFFQIYVDNNKIVGLQFDISKSFINHHYVYTIDFDYDNFNFDTDSLISGFTLYNPN